MGNSRKREETRVNNWKRVSMERDDCQSRRERSAKSRMQRACDKAGGWKVTTREAFALYGKHALVDSTSDRSFIFVSSA